MHLIISKNILYPNQLYQADEFILPESESPQVNLNRIYARMGSVELDSKFVPQHTQSTHPKSQSYVLPENFLSEDDQSDETVFEFIRKQQFKNLITEASIYNPSN